MPSLHTPYGFQQVIDTLLRADGHGYVRVFKFDYERRALLLEKLGLSMHERKLEPKQVIPLLCKTLQHAWLVPPGADQTMNALEYKRRKPTTSSTPGGRFAPNQLNREFAASVPNQKWVSDTKAVETAEGWLYLAVILDLFSRMVVGWAMAATEDEQLVELALRMALATRHPPAGLLHHSDRGREFTSERSLALLQEAGLDVSMSRTGDCYDNAAMEAFFATLTKECTDRVRFQTRQEARSAIFEYLECLYNPVRFHST